MNRRIFLKHAAAAAGTAWICGPWMRSALAGDPEGASSFCFCVVADPHAAEGPKPGLEPYGSGVDKFAACVRAIEEMDAASRPDFLLLLGDIHPEAIKPSLSLLDIPVHVTPGNHESDRETRNLLRAMFPDDFKVDGSASDYYSFVHKGVRFISMCDAGKGGEHVGQFCSENIEPSGQCEWIERELALPEPRKILFAHIPPEPDGADRNMFLSRNDSRWFNALVAERQPLAMFFGHLHLPTREYSVGRTRVFQVRSCCWNFNNAPIGFLHVRVTGDIIETREILTGEPR